MTEVLLNPGMDAQQNSRRQLTFVGLSILAHILLLLILYRTPLLSDFQVPDNTVFVDLDKLPPLSQQQTASQEQSKAKQIVESEAADNNRKSKDAKYLGERDQAVDEETKAKQVDLFRKGGAPSKAGTGGQRALTLKNLAPTAKAFTPPTKAEIDGWKQQQQQQQAAQKQENMGGEKAADNAGSASNDYLKDVKEGNRTLLSTKEFVYFGYYRRIREKLEVAWNTKLRSTLGDYVYGGRHLAADHNYVTGLIVVLDRYGKITAVQVLQNSGAHDLDQAAVDAFNEAGPFPDPPSGLVDADGTIKIRWDFILQS
jgi:TonB family protein